METPTKSSAALRQQRYRDRHRRDQSGIHPIQKRRAENAGVIFPRGQMRAIEFGQNFSMDSWQNLITGMNVRGHDRKLATTFQAEGRMAYQDLTDIYRSDGLGRIVLDRIIGDMTRAWWAVEGDTDKKIEGALKRVHAKKEVKRALRWADLYGGSLLIMILDDGVEDLQMPVNLNRLKGIKQLLPFDRYRIVINPADLYLDPSNDSYGHPEIYRITPIFGEPFFVHESRTLRFEGDDVPDVTRFQNQGWADSIFQSCFDRLRACGETYSNIEHIIGEFVIGVLKVPNLLQLLAEKDEETIKAYINQIDQSKHVLNSILVDPANGQGGFERHSSTTTGLKELVDLILESLCAQKGIPMCLLYGRSQGGLSDDEASQVRFWYDRVNVMQEEKMLDQMERLVNYANIGLGHVVEDDSPIKFNPLWQPTQKDLVDMRNKQADTDGKYVAMGAIVDPQVTIGKSRFGGQAYSFETVLSKNETDPNFKTPAEEQAEIDAKNQLALAGAKGGANKNMPQGHLGGPKKPNAKDSVAQDSSDGIDLEKQGLTTLQGLHIPEKVNGFFKISGNQLKDHIGGPRFVDGAFISNHNPLESLQGSPEVVQDFHCNSSGLKSLRFMPDETNDCHVHNNDITSFQYLGKVKKDLHCYFNKITSFEYLPEELPGDFFASDNQFTTLDYFPKRIEGDVDLQHNPGNFTEAQVRAACQVKGKVRV